MNKERILTTIDWQPFGRSVVVEANKEESTEISLKSSGFIDPAELSDGERLQFGLTSKSAAIANQSSEEQAEYIVVAIGAECSWAKVGDRVMFMPGCQATSIKIKGKFYLQLGEFETMGTFL